MTQEPKRPKRGRKEIGGINNPYATLGSENGDGETVTPQGSQTVSPSNDEAVTPLNRDTVRQLDGEREGAEEQKHGETVIRSHRETASPLNDVTVSQLDGLTVSPSNRETVKSRKEKKITFYFTPEEEAKLDHLEIDYRQRTGQRINRNDIIRYLLKQVILIPDNAQFD